MFTVRQQLLPQHETPAEIVSIVTPFPLRTRGLLSLRSFRIPLAENSFSQPQLLSFGAPSRSAGNPQLSPQYVGLSVLVGNAFALSGPYLKLAS
jgi:hypothetical protein